MNAVFTSHDDLEAALVGAEDAVIGLVDRFDLDEEPTDDLKGLLVGYATRVAAELDSGSARAAAALAVLRPWFGLLAQEAVYSSQARELMAAGALNASRGGRTDDWEGLCAGSTPAQDGQHWSLSAWYGPCRACMPTCADCTPQRAPPSPAAAPWLSPERY
ncbi:hypothetical protein ACFV7Q_11475 [Streptomyces sp. NPDC059851]|uniref:hypothetical protein n=1 Tax=Streptomyces sp. NPDC059851 TaxID=3346971 RepID=UPI003656A3C5